MPLKYFNRICNSYFMSFQLFWKERELNAETGNAPKVSTPRQLIYPMMKNESELKAWITNNSELISVIYTIVCNTILRPSRKKHKPAKCDKPGNKSNQQDMATILALDSLVESELNRIEDQVLECQLKNRRSNFIGIHQWREHSWGKCCKMKLFHLAPGYWVIIITRL